VVCRSEGTNHVFSFAGLVALPRYVAEDSHAASRPESFVDVSGGGGSPRVGRVGTRARSSVESDVTKLPPSAPHPRQGERQREREEDKRGRMVGTLTTVVSSSGGQRPCEAHLGCADEGRRGSSPSTHRGLMGRRKPRWFRKSVGRGGLVTLPRAARAAHEHWAPFRSTLLATTGGYDAS